jgi:hypothetical protein
MGSRTDYGGEAAGSRRQKLWVTSHAFRQAMWLRPSEVQAWNYRRHVLASHPVPKTVEDELTYTEKKIQANFSNFSAWHQRSKVSAQLHDSMEWIDSGKLSYTNCLAQFSMM